MSEDDVCEVWCLINCQREPFSVPVSLEWNVDKLTKAIQRAKHDLLCLDTSDIVLLKLNALIPVDPDPTLAQRLPKPIIDFCDKLDRRTRKVSDVFPGGLAKDHLHIIVELPSKSKSFVICVCGTDDLPTFFCSLAIHFAFPSLLNYISKFWKVSQCDIRSLELV